MRPPRLLALAVLAASLWLSPAARAHISLERGGTHLSRYGDAEIKDAPCGRLNGTRGTNVYTYAPGETITVTFDEYVPHPGYFRIAFDDDGDDDFEDPASIDPISRDCLSDPADQCGQSDFYNNDTVLMDNLEPHTTGGGLHTFEVTLPDVECDNCTLQVIQVMEDAIHGPYNPSSSGVTELFYVEDVYHTCIDLVLSADAAPGGGTGGAPVMMTGGTGGEPMMMPTGGSSGGEPAPSTPTGGSGGSEPVGVGNMGGAGEPVAAAPAPTPVPGAIGGSAGGVTPTAGAPASSSGGSDDGGCGVAPAGAVAGSSPLALALALLWLARRRRR